MVAYTTTRDTQSRPKGQRQDLATWCLSGGHQDYNQQIADTSTMRACMKKGSTYSMELIAANDLVWHLFVRNKAGPTARDSHMYHVQHVISICFIVAARTAREHT